MASVKPKLIIGNITDPIEGSAGNILSKAHAIATAPERDMDWLNIYAEATDGDFTEMIMVLSEHFDVEYQGSIDVDRPLWTESELAQMGGSKEPWHDLPKEDSDDVGA